MTKLFSFITVTNHRDHICFFASDIHVVENTVKDIIPDVLNGTGQVGMAIGFFHVPLDGRGVSFGGVVQQ